MAATGRRDERSFVRKRLVALALLGCVLVGAATLLVLQVFGSGGLVVAAQAALQ